MKTETKIAEENIKLLKQRMQTLETNARRSGLCISHKASCQRESEFLEYEIMKNSHMTNICSRCDNTFDKVKGRQTDLQNAIKKYDEAGI